MKLYFILARGIQKKRNAKFIIAIILLFLAASCKKEGKPAEKTEIPFDDRYLTYNDLAWIESVPDSGFQLKVPSLPDPYDLSRLKGVFLIIELKHCPYLSKRKHCMDLSDGVPSYQQELEKDGDTSGLIFYAIRSAEVVLYVKRSTDPFFLNHKETVILHVQ